jgi:hypothetical protein
MDAPDGRAATDDEPFASEPNVKVPELVNDAFVPRARIAFEENVNDAVEGIVDAHPLPMVNVPGPFMTGIADASTTIPFVAPVRIAPETMVRIGAVFLPNSTE